MDDVEMDEDSSGGWQPHNELLQQEEDLEDDFYIPPPRPDLDLGPDTALLLQCRAASPALSYISMSSGDLSGGTEPGGDFVTRYQLERTDSYSSCYSVDSEDCETMRPKVKMKAMAVSSSETPDPIAAENDLRLDCLTVEFSCKAISDTLKQLSEVDIKKFGRTLWKNYPRSLRVPPEELDMVAMVDSLLDSYGLMESLSVTRKVLEQIGRRRAADNLQHLCVRNEVRHDLARSLRTTYGVDGGATAFNDVYSDLCITLSSDGGPNVEHEVLKIEKPGSSQEAGLMLSTSDILSRERVEKSHITLVFLTGVAGSGKSSLVRKLILDWVDKRSHQHVSFLFPLPLRVLQQFEGDKVSLMDVLHRLYPETQRLKDSDFSSEDCTMMFVCDGLDEYQGELDFTATELLSDHTERTSLNVLVVNLLRGRLLYRGLFLFTTRPQVRGFIPWDAHHEVIQVRGFTEEAKVDFFRKRFEDPTQAASIVSYLASNPTLRIMCHLPLFCSVVAEECGHRFKHRRSGPPGTLCYAYTKFLVVLLHQRRPLSAPLEFLMRLGHLAFYLLEQGKFRICKSDWSRFRVSDVEAVTHSGLCTEYLTKPFVLYEERVISFIHPTVQEHLAALYAFLSFKNQTTTDVPPSDSLTRLLKSSKKSFYHKVLDRSLQCDDGRLDIFLRFLSGLHLKTNIDLLSSLCVTTQTSTDEPAALLRKRMEKNQHPERNHNLRCCLLELQQT